MRWSISTANNSTARLISLGLKNRLDSARSRAAAPLQLQQRFEFRQRTQILFAPRSFLGA
jgi:hypothetical protein